METSGRRRVALSDSGVRLQELCLLRAFLPVFHQCRKEDLNSGAPGDFLWEA